MNALIIYDSWFGNTRNVAQALARTLHECVPLRLVPVREVDVNELQGVRLLVIGSPTQQYRPTPALQALLEQISHGMLQGVIAGAFDTRYRISCWSSGSAAWSIARFLQDTGAVLALPPESFFVSEVEGPLEEGEIERATHWARTFWQKAKTMANASEPSSPRLL